LAGFLACTNLKPQRYFAFGQFFAGGDLTYGLAAPRRADDTSPLLSS
jgi:hypothetical protein